ncbi:MAG: VWA domain-containing protein [Myxococcales bacterium]|nr:VWA domain-containing protein [Myxococcales bacterium]
MIAVRALASLSLAACLALAACGSDSSNFNDGANGGDKGGDGKGSSSGFGGDGTDKGDGDGNGDGKTCAATVAQTTKAKVDIIFVIDNSGSMGEEMAQVQANINNFAKKIGSSGLDYQVIFIVRKTGGDLKICVPEPLAKPGCADNPPLFRHIDQSVGSSNSFQLILSTYDNSNANLAWGQHLRADAFKVFIGVSDDGRSDLEAAKFDQDLIAKGAGQFGTAENRKYAYHAICGWTEGTTPPSTQKCSSADGNGIKYQNLALLTGGLIDSVCKTDYSGVLDNIGKGIVDRLACELGYPTAQAADPTTVEVQFTPTGKASQKLVQVTDVSKCAANPDGWYYDDMNKPTKIILCKSICDTANTTPGSKIEALVGCKGAGPK